MSLPTDYKERKAIPIGTGVLDYFHDALAEVAKVSKAGNDQHNPGQPLHWQRGKSQDHYDTLIRHSIERGTIDSDGTRHSAKMAWRALALLQEELEAAAGDGKISRGSWPAEHEKVAAPALAAAVPDYVKEARALGLHPPCHAQDKRFHCDVVCYGDGHPCIEPHVLRMRMNPVAEERNRG